MQAEANTLAHARAAVANRLRRGESVPGFGHPLYPEGDPPATELIRLAEASRNEGERRAVRNLAKAARSCSRICRVSILVSRP
jgi:citrate synthase